MKRVKITKPDYIDLKIPPQAVDIEEAVIGACLLERNAISKIVDFVQPETFYKDANQTIFKAVMTLYSEGSAIDQLTVKDQLVKTGELEYVGGPYYLTQLTNRVASSANIEAHARIITEQYIKRNIIELCSNTIEGAYDDSMDFGELLDDLSNKLIHVTTNTAKKSFRTSLQVLKDTVKAIEEIGTKKDKLLGVPSGFTDLDRITNGWQDSDLIIIAARPGMGKTAFAMQLARNAAVDFDKQVAVFSLEMSEQQLMIRLLSSECNINHDKIRSGKLTPLEWQQMNEKINPLCTEQLHINDDPGLTAMQFKSMCGRMKLKHDIEMIIVDYLQLMTPGIKTNSRNDDLGVITRALKLTAKEFNVPVICLSQLSRAVESRGDKRPLLSDLRESGNIEQDADMVMFLYRPEYYKITETDKGESTDGLNEVIIAKHRNGQLGTVNLKFIGEHVKFAEWNEQPTEKEYLW